MRIELLLLPRMRRVLRAGTGTGRELGWVPVPAVR